MHRRTEISMSTPAHHHHHPAPTPDTGASGVEHEAGELIDPVCGMRVGPDAPESATYRGTLYRFCSRHCAEAFRKEPGRYVKLATPPAKTAAPASAAGTIYTCPMHPQIRQSA